MKNINSPKYIYLDQNKWIELAKGLKNRESKYETLYEKMKSNVESGVWAFPLSIIHVSETMKRKNKESRENLLNLMYSLSKGCSISDYATTNIEEFYYWIKNGIVDYKKMQSKVIEHDLNKIVGQSISNISLKCNDNLDISNDKINHIKELLAKHSCSIELLQFVCEICSSLNEDEDFYYDCFVKARDDFNNWKVEIEKSDNYKEKHVYPAYLTKTFFEEYKSLITNLSKEDQYKLKIIFENNTKNKEQSINLLESLPGFNIYNRLVYELLSNPYKAVHKHDFFDLAFLRVAIPYCDVVIGENYWIDRIQHYKLDKKFNTKSSTKLFELEKL